MISPTRVMRAQRLAAPAPPSWVLSLIEHDRVPTTGRTREGAHWQLTSNDAWTLITITLPDAAHLSAAAFQQSITQAYLQLLQLLRAHGDHQPVRFWNYIPRILDEAEAGRDRYMMFNAGRHEAFSQSLRAVAINDTQVGSQGDSHRTSLGASLVAASAVDHGGDDLHIHLLASSASHRQVDNPRQRPAFEYSPRYGPVPPSFARATLVDPVHAGDPLLLITAGTASVLGEDSHHHRDVHLQLTETITNLAVLIWQAQPDAGCTMDRIEHDATLAKELLACTRYVRAYVTHVDEEAIVELKLREVFCQSQSIELMPAVLCRNDLRVEVEILAHIASPGSTPRKAKRQRP